MSLYAMQRTPAPRFLDPLGRGPVLCPSRRQRGAAVLVVTAALFVAMVLGALFANRNLVFEQRSSANQYRSTQAFEAAEAGLEWALTQLNNPQRLGADCQPVADLAANSFRARYLGFDQRNAEFAARTWLRGGAPAALQPSCVRSGAAWSCSCPVSGDPVLAVPEGNEAAPAFTIQFLPTGRPGIVRVTSIGCTRLARPCVPGDPGATLADATAKLDVAFGLLAALRTPPVAALTTRGAVDADAATLGVHNADPATGIAIHAGAAIAASHARLSVPAGAPSAGALIGNDAALAGTSGDGFFIAHFGLSKAGWKDQPAVTRIDCSVDCSGVLTRAIDAAADGALVYVDGDLALSGPMLLGSARRPVAIVVSGAARFDGAIGLHGAVYSAAMSWHNTSGGAFVRGAVLSEGGYEGNGAPDLIYDAAVLATLAGNAGTFARVNGSWRDF